MAWNPNYFAQAQNTSTRNMPGHMNVNTSTAPMFPLHPPNRTFNFSAPTPTDATRGTLALQHSLSETVSHPSGGPMNQNLAVPYVYPSDQRDPDALPFFFLPPLWRPHVTYKLGLPHFAPELPSNLPQYPPLAAQTSAGTAPQTKGKQKMSQQELSLATAPPVSQQRQQQQTVATPASNAPSSASTSTKRKHAVTEDGITIKRVKTGEYEVRMWQLPKSSIADQVPPPPPRPLPETAVSVPDARASTYNPRGNRTATRSSQRPTTPSEAPAADADAVKWPAPSRSSGPAASASTGSNGTASPDGTLLDITNSSPGTGSPVPRIATLPDAPASPSANRRKRDATKTHRTSAMDPPGVNMTQGPVLAHQGPIVTSDSVPMVAKDKSTAQTATSSQITDSATDGDSYSSLFEEFINEDAFAQSESEKYDVFGDPI